MWKGNSICGRHVELERYRHDVIYTSRTTTLFCLPSNSLRVNHTSFWIPLHTGNGNKLLSSCIAARQAPSRKMVCDPLLQKQGKDRPGSLAAGAQPTTADV